VRGGAIPWSDAATLAPQPLLGRRLTAGEIGCAVSHLRLWQRVAGSDTTALILEDDCSTRTCLACSTRSSPESATGTSC